jgi:hypothetical protein
VGGRRCGRGRCCRPASGPRRWRACGPGRVALDWGGCGRPWSRWVAEHRRQLPDRRGPVGLQGQGRQLPNEFAVGEWGEGQPHSMSTGTHDPSGRPQPVPHEAILDSTGPQLKSPGDAASGALPGTCNRKVDGSSPSVGSTLIYVMGPLSCPNSLKRKQRLDWPPSNRTVLLTKCSHRVEQAGAG